MSDDLELPRFSRRIGVLSFGHEVPASSTRSLGAPAPFTGVLGLGSGRRDVPAPDLSYLTLQSVVAEGVSMTGDAGGDADETNADETSDRGERKVFEVVRDEPASADPSGSHTRGDDSLDAALDEWTERIRRGVERDTRRFGTDSAGGSEFDRETALGELSLTPAVPTTIVAAPTDAGRFDRRQSEGDRARQRSHGRDNEPLEPRTDRPTRSQTTPSLSEDSEPPTGDLTDDPESNRQSGSPRATANLTADVPMTVVDASRIGGDRTRRSPDSAAGDSFAADPGTGPSAPESGRLSETADASGRGPWSVEDASGWPDDSPAAGRGLGTTSDTGTVADRPLPESVSLDADGPEGRFVESLYRELRRKSRIERERRGL